MIVFEVDSRGDGIHIPPEYRKELERYRNQSRKLRIMIAPVFKKRTLAQNALFHAKLKTIERLTGLGWEEIKNEVKKEAILMGYPYKKDIYGDPVTDDDGELVPISSADATIEQMNLLMDALDQWCIINDIDIGEIWNE